MIRGHMAIDHPALLETVSQPNSGAGDLPLGAGRIPPAPAD